ncbi:MAG: hypothetical protein NVS3B7_10180 [Candidatus Elarobacter sp.]
MASACGGALRRASAAVAIVALVACSRTQTNAPKPVASGSGTVGYVRMNELVQKHPLYQQLARYDRSIEAFDLTATAPHAIAPDPQLARREAELSKQLSDAANRTTLLLNEKQKQYQAQEAQAINAALQGAGRGGPSAAQISGSVNATAAQQRGGVNAQAARDFETYRASLQKQDRAQLAAAQQALAQRADRTYRAKADDLHAKESALTLTMSTEDAPQRLALRTKLSSLALDDAAREEAQKELTGLDRREADALAAQRNRDAQTLSALQVELHNHVQSELNAQADAIRTRSMGSLTQRQNALTKQIASAPNRNAPVIQTTNVNGHPQQQINPNLPPALRARIEQLHNDYQKRFKDDAKTTIASFEKTRADLSRRYAERPGVAGTARNGAQAQILNLRKKREELYGRITGQINREVSLIAQQRGISIVLTDVVAPAAGVDLTADALKDIESLNE